MAFSQEEVNSLLGDEQEESYNTAKLVYVGTTRAVLKEAKLNSNGDSLSVDLDWRTEDEITDVEGKTHQPGVRIFDRINFKRANVDPDKGATMTRIAVETAAKIAKAAGKLTSPKVTLNQVVAALGQSEGVRMQLRLSENSKNEYQDIKYARAN